MFRTLVHEETLPDYAEVLDWERATYLVEHAGNWAVSLCHCRHVAHHMGHDCSKFGLDTCLSLGLAADYLVRRKLGKKIEKGRALELIAQSRDAGLVHIADNVQNRPAFVCNCCGCCCEILQAFKRFRWMGNTFTSNFEAGSARQRCTGCKKCQKACPVNAVTMVDDTHEVKGRKIRFTARVDHEVCIGAASVC